MSDFNRSICNDQKVLHYTAHSNWEWVVQLNISKYEHFVKVQRCNKMLELPSCREVKVKPFYSLIRMEETILSTGCLTKGFWLSSKAFGFLDPKDALHNHFIASKCFHAMPETKLLSWDGYSEENIGQLPSVPALLKASLGSGGNGLYFVHSVQQVQEIMQLEAQRAEAHPGFIPGLIRDYGSVPKWSLQQYIESIRRKSDSRKCQFRVYAITMGFHMYLYTKEVEVRLPYWEAGSVSSNIQDSIPSSLKDKSVASAATTDLMGSRPYNEARNKSETERIVLSELEDDEDFAPLHGAIVNHVAASLYSLKELYLSHARACGIMTKEGQPLLAHLFNSSPLVEMGVAGIDIMVGAPCTSSTEPAPRPTAYIVEFNNNPALPGKDKKMSTKYQQHLRDFMGCLCSLGGFPTDHMDFSGYVQQVW